MSLDERIHQLSETIIAEVRAPIEAALHRLLADVTALAEADRDQAVQAALADSTAAQEAALAGLRDQYARESVDVEALRSQFDRELDASLAALREQLEREHEAATAALRETLAAEREAALAAARQQFEQEREVALAAAGADIERDRHAALEELRAELARHHEAALKFALETAGQEADRAHRSEIDAIESRAAADREAAVQAVRDESAREQESAVDARTAAEAAAGAALTAALATEEQARRDAEARAAELEAQRDQARTEASDARQAALHAEEQVRAVDARLRDAEQKAQDAALVHASDRQEDLACSDRTVASFRRLDAALSLSEVLNVLAEQAAVETGRAAILLVDGDRLRGWEAHGAQGIDAGAIDAPIEPDSIFGLAISTGLPVSTADAPVGSDADTVAGLIALPPGRAGLAVPLTVGGRTVAILYADDGGDRVGAVPSSWPEIAEILARHAGHRLEVLTVSHAAALAGRVQQEGRASGRPAGQSPDDSPQADERREEESARRYARLLISEIKLYNEAAVEQGRENRDLLMRLGEDIERARRLYEEKIPAAVRQRVHCFDQEVVRTLAGGDAGLLGQT